MARDHELWLEETSTAPRSGWTDCGGGILHECMAWLPQGMIEHKVLAFVTSHGGTLVESTEDRLRVRLPLQNEVRRARRFRRQPEPLFLLIDVQLHRHTVCIKSMTHITLHLQPVGPDAAADTLRPQCIELAKDLRACLMAEPLERRFAERTVAEFPVEMWHLGDDERLSAPQIKFDAIARDRSASGIAVWTSEKPAAKRLCVKYFDRAADHVVWATARVVRTTPAIDGRHLCAVQFERVVRFAKRDDRAQLPHPKLETLFGKDEGAASTSAVPR